MKDETEVTESMNRTVAEIEMEEYGRLGKNPCADVLTEDDLAQHRAWKTRMFGVHYGRNFQGKPLWTPTEGDFA